MKHYVTFFILILTFLSACKKPPGPGGNSQISGHVDIIDHVSERAEITHVTLVTGDDLKDDEYILLNTPAGKPNYYVWFSNSGGGDPNFSDRIAIPVDFSGGQDASAIARNVENALKDEASESFNVTRDGDILIIVNIDEGEVTDGSNGSTPIDIDVKVQGKNSQVFSARDAANVEVYLVYGDDAIYSKDFTTDPSGNYLFTGLTKGDYTIFVYTKDTIENITKPIETTVEIAKNESNVTANNLLVID